jgi:hypothetical protein
MEIGIKGDQFIDESTGEPLKLAGSHTWNTVQPFNGKTTRSDQLTGNFTRLWTVETRGAVLSTSSWGSNSTGLVRIGAVPWRSEGSLNGRYYRRLENVVAKAEKRDIVTGVVFFDHAFNAYFPGGWANHPFNGLGPKDPSQVHTRGSWNRYQKAHVRRTVNTLAEYDNVIYEVGNELHRNSVPWFQQQVVRWVEKLTKKPVGVSYASGVYADQSWMTKVGADWIVPSNSPRSGGVRKLPGFKGPQVLDTDHAWALSSNVAGLREAWRQGRSLWLMDGLGGTVLRNRDNLAPDRAFIESIT